MTPRSDQRAEAAPPGQVVQTDTFGEIADAFASRVARIAWCTVATVGPDGAPRTRVMHPIWEGPTGWIATTPGGLKGRHLAHEPRIALTYWDPSQEVVSVQAAATWIDDDATRRHVWQLFTSTPPPLGYDPTAFWPGGPTDPRFGVLRLDAAMIELTAMASVAGPRLRWRR